MRHRFCGTILDAIFHHILDVLLEGPLRVEDSSTYDRFLELALNPILEDGRKTGVSVFAKDITERKRAEATRQESETKFRTLSDFVPQLVWMCTPDGLHVYFNQRWADYTGLTLEESYGTGWNTPYHPDDKQPARDAWNHAVATGDTYRIECRLRAADGSYRWFLTKGVPLPDATGRIVGWFGTCTDIDDLKRAGAELVAVNKELEAFNYAVAHDLRAPLRHIHGFADLLSEESGPVLNDSSKRYLETIQSSVDHMGQLLEDLLSLSRLGRQELHMQVCGLSSLVEEVVSALKPDITDRQVEWRIADLPFVECDSTLMKQVLLNLVSNALKFTRSRRPAIIEIGETMVDGKPAIFVRDNGVGFSMKYVDKLFGLFQRLHRQQDFEGTGVGLAVVQRIMHRHGGRVWAEAELNKGATFYLTLHACEAEKKDLTAA